MGSSGGKGGSSAPKPSAEYQQYLNEYNLHNTGEARQERVKVPHNPVSSSGSGEGGLWGSSKDRYKTITTYGDPIEGEWTGTNLMSEQEFYIHKSEQQQQAMMDQMAQQQQQITDQMNQQAQNMQTEMAAQQAELKAKREEEYRQAQIGNRDALMGDRLTAEEAAINYVNSQIDKERSNAALFGMDYRVDQADKDNRIKSYFNDIWGQGEESQLQALFAEVGMPDGFEGFSFERDGSIGGSQSTEEVATNKLVGTSKGMTPKKKRGAGGIVSPETSVLANTSNPKSQDYTSILGG